MENSELIEEIESSRKIPKEVKEKINTKIFKNLIAAVVVMAYLLLINFTYHKSSNFEELVKYYSCVISIVSVVFFEIAYNKKNVFYCIIGIELLSCGILSIYIPYIYLHTNTKFRTVVMMLPAILVVYYFIKALIISKKEKIEYKESLSDIKDILKDDKTSYLDENSEKTYKNKLKEEEKYKQAIKKEQEIRRKKRK